MSAQTVRQPVDLDPPAPAHPHLDLALDLAHALLSIPSVALAWDFAPGDGFTTGVPLGIAAIIFGPQVHAPGGARGSRTALSAIIVGALAVLSVAFFATDSSPDSTAQCRALELGLTPKEIALDGGFTPSPTTARLRGGACRSISLGRVSTTAHPPCLARSGRI